MDKRAIVDLVLIIGAGIASGWGGFVWGRSTRRILPKFPPKVSEQQGQAKR